MNVKIVPAGAGIEARFDGDLDESALSVLLGLPPRLAARPLRLVLGRVRRINSVGAGEWARCMEQLAAPFELHECPETFMDYALVAREVLGAGRIASFLASAECAACREETVLLVAMAGGSAVPPACGACGGPRTYPAPVAEYLAL